MTLEQASNNIVRNKNESAWREYVRRNPRKCDEYTLQLGLARIDDLAYTVKVMRVIPPARIFYHVATQFGYAD